MRRQISLALVGVLLAGCALPGLVFAEEAAPAFPYGRWEGSVIGEGLDKEGKPKQPIAVKIWLSDNGDGTVGISISTPAVPFAFSTKPSTPQKVSGGWDLPVTVAYGKGKRAIRGTGVVKLRERTDGWYAWGSGTGSALGSKEGSGHGSATRATTESRSLVDQFLSPIKDTAESFVDDTAVPVPTEYPEAEFADTPAEPPTEPPAGTSTDAEPTPVSATEVDEAAPNGVEAFAILMALLLMYGVLGILMFLGIIPPIASDIEVIGGTP
jgi:cell division septation protein DedD